MDAVTLGPRSPYRSIVDALIILVRDGQVLLAQRQGTGYADGAWNLPSGKLEDGETVSQAAVREGLEEVGVRITEDALRFVHLIHYRNAHGDARIGVFFQALHWDGEPYTPSRTSAPACSGGRSASRQPRHTPTPPRGSRRTCGANTTQ